MLGLRNASFGKRSASNSSLPPVDKTSSAANTTELMAPTSPQTPSGSPTVTRTKSTANGTPTITRTESHSKTTHGHGEITIVKDILSELRVKLRDEISPHFYASLPAIDSLEMFLDYIDAERLRRMPHKGSRWDKVLRWAEDFASLSSVYEGAIGAFVSHSKEAAQLVWAFCQKLLQMGPTHIIALERAFALFYKLGLSLATFLRYRTLFAASGDIRMILAQAYVDLLVLVTNILIYFQKTDKEKLAKSAATNFDALFGETLTIFLQRKVQIVNILWVHQLQESTEIRSISIDVSTINDWLAPPDHLVRTLTSDRTGAKGVRDEFTCEWFQRYLIEFVRSKDDIFTVSGKAGCGKSVLFGWIAERMHRKVGPKSYDTISYAVEADIPAALTSMALVKALLGQVLDQSVGNIELYTSLVAAFEISAESKDQYEVEKALWRSLDIGLQSAVNLMIIIDGLDLLDEKTSAETFEHLHHIANKHSAVRMITLSRSPIHVPKSVRSFAIEPHHLHQDIGHVIEQSLHHHHHFKDLKPENKELIVRKLTDKAQGSFVWADLALELIKREKSRDEFVAVLDKLPAGGPDLVQKLLSTLDLSKYETKHLLSWLIVAQRPLTLKEIGILLEIDVGKAEPRNRVINVEETVKHALGSLVVMRNSIVRFRQTTVREYLVDLSTKGTTLMPLADAQRDLTTRILAYIKIHISHPSEPAFEPMSYHAVNEYFHKHTLLEYTVRYWTIHFSHSSLRKPDGSLNLHSDFRSVFPSSTLLTFLEWTCWQHQVSTIEALDMYLLSLTIRQAVFGEKHECIIQTQTVIARAYEKLTLTIEASTYYSRVVHLSQTVLGKFSSLAIHCAKAYLTCTTSVTTTSRTETTTQKEEILKYLVTAEKHKHGTANESTIKYSKMLAQLYIDIHEIRLAAAIYREVYRACVELYGQFSEEVTTVSESLTIVLHEESERESIIRHFREAYEVAEKTMRITDIRRIRVTIRMAEIYESLKEIAVAEEIYVTLWRKIIEAHRVQRTTDSYERKIQVTIYYVRFLLLYHRHVEAESILRGCWNEFKREENKSDGVIIQLKIVGELMKDLGITETSHSIFSYIWNYFKGSKKQHYAEAASTAVLMAETSKDAHSHTNTSTYETIFKEILETTTTTTIDVRTIETCQTLTTYYARQERWADAITVCEKLLTRLWSNLITNRSVISLPKDFTLEAIHSGKRLAHYHARLGHAEEAEKLYVYIYRATKSRYKIQEEVAWETCKALVDFYENTTQIDKAIAVYELLIKDYTRALGATHKATIRALYAVAEFCSKYKKNAEHWYLQIVTSLNRRSDVCHADAMKAATILAELYYEQKKWHEAQRLYAVLWRTFIKKGKQLEMTIDYVKTLYERYFYILDKEIKVKYSELRQVTIEYKETCTKVFGAHAEITIEAMFRLAEVCERSEEHRHEAITFYEQAIKMTKTITTTTTMTATIRTLLTISKHRLTHLYVTDASSSSEYSHKAITVSFEHYEEIKHQHGCSHETTITTLKEFVLLCKKHETEHNRTVALKALRDLIIEILIKEKHSKKLSETGASIAAIYIQAGYIERGWELLHELRRRIIVGDVKSNEKLGIKSEQSFDKLSYVFLVSFEESLKDSKTNTFSEDMAGILTETLLYEHYHKFVRSSSSFEHIMFHGAQLRSFLVEKKRKEQVKVLDDELYAIYEKNLGHGIKASQQIKLVFFHVILEELGKDKPDRHLKTAACIAGNEHVLSLLKQSKFQEALELATCLYHFVNHHGGYHDAQNIEHGFSLSLYLAGRNTNIPKDNKSQPQLMALSSTVLTEILHAAKSLKVEFAQMEITRLNTLANLMGEQQKFDDVEWLLTQLWNSRHSQSSWSSATIVSIGRRLVEVRFSRTNQKDSAIHLCEDIVYNLRRAWGPLDKTTLEMSNLLSRLYNSAGRHKDAMDTHEEILRQYASFEHDATDHDDAPHVVSEQFEMLKGSYVRQGNWADKDKDTLRDIHASLESAYGKSKGWKSGEATDIEKWNPKDPKAVSGTESYVTFSAPAHWDFMSKEEVGKRHQKLTKRRSYIGATSLSQSFTGNPGKPGANGRASSFVGNSIQEDGED